MYREIDDDEMNRSGRTTRPAWHAPLLTDHVVADVTGNVVGGDGNDASEFLVS